MNTIRLLTQNDDFSELGWESKGVSKSIKSLITECKNEKILGGYGITGRGTALIRKLRLPAHKKVTVKAKIWAFDSFDNEHIFISVNG